MCRLPATFKCSFVFKLEEPLVSRHRNMSFFVFRIRYQQRGEKGGEEPGDICSGSDVMLISGSEG